MALGENNTHVLVQDRSGHRRGSPLLCRGRLDCVSFAQTEAYYLVKQYFLRWNKRQAGGGADQDQDAIIREADGFASLSRRSSTSKPIIAAVNGGAYGGGTEIVLNCDLVIAGEDAKFALPEVRRGVVAVQGGSSVIVTNHHAYRLTSCQRHATLGTHCWSPGTP